MGSDTTGLDQALDLADQESEALEAGNVEAAFALASRRLTLQESCLDSDGALPSEAIGEKLEQLRKLQGRLMDEARSLHARLSDDLHRLRREHTRLSGYGSQSRVLPLVNRFVSKRG